MVAVSAVAQDVYPPRVLVTVSGLVGGEDVDVTRQVAGTRTRVRGGLAFIAPAGSFLVLDAELPFGIPVTYVAEVDGTEYASTTTTYSLPSSAPVWSDAISGRAAEAVIRAWPEKAFTREGSDLTLASGRRAAISAPFGQFTGQIEAYLPSTTARRVFEDLIRNATSGIVQIRQAGGYDDVDAYVHVRAYQVRRYSQDGTDERRTVVVDVAEVDGWYGGLEAAGYTLQDVADVYESPLTLQDLADDFATLLDVAQAEFVA